MAEKLLGHTGSLTGNAGHSVVPGLLADEFGGFARSL